MPLDPKYPKDRMLYMLDQAKAKVVITQAALRARLPVDTTADIIVLEEIAEQLKALDGDTNLDKANNSSRDLAYVIYTSGSTGRPKGVMLEHRSLLNYVNWHIEYYEMTNHDRVLHNAGLAFDASMAETWPTLCGGRYSLSPYKYGDSPRSTEVATVDVGHTYHVGFFDNSTLRGNFGGDLSERSGVAVFVYGRR